MSQLTASKAAHAGAKPATRRPQEIPAALELRYGRIGISAVAAAARYQGGAANLANAPAVAGKKPKGEN
jgi:hypothetical protein